MIFVVPQPQAVRTGQLIRVFFAYCSRQLLIVISEWTRDSIAIVAAFSQALSIAVTCAPRGGGI